MSFGDIFKTIEPTFHSSTLATLLLPTMSHYISSRMSARPGDRKATKRNLIQSTEAWVPATTVTQDTAQVLGLYKAALQGDANLFMHIVTVEGMHMINQQDQHGIPPLVYATLSDNPSCIERLQELGGFVVLV